MREVLLNSHFTDTAELKVFKKINQYNEREYEDDIKIIPCRKVYQTTVTKNQNNEDVISTITLYTFVKINAMDNIDGKDVLQITEWKSLLDNKVVAYKIML